MTLASIRDPSYVDKWPWQELLKYGCHKRSCAAVRLVAQEECNCGWETVKKIAQKQVKTSG